MKHLFFILALIGLTACNNEKWGYKSNPDYVLFEAYQSVKDANILKWLKVTTGNAYCKYSTPKALAHLNEEVLSKADFNKLKLSLVSEQNLSDAEYESSFWVFHKKFYKASAIEKGNGRKLATINVVCFYGAKENIVANKNRPAIMYPNKFCAIQKIDFVSARDYEDNGLCDE